MIASLHANYLTFEQNNIATPECLEKLRKVNILPQKIIPRLPATHPVNLARLLQKNGCFQKDCDFYKKGNESEFSKQLRFLLLNTANALKFFSVKNQKPLLISSFPVLPFRR